MRHLVVPFAILAAAYALVSPVGAAGGGALKPRAKVSLCKPAEQVVTSCHPKGLTFALCAADGPKEKYIVYREVRSAGPVRQFPQDPTGQIEQFHYSSEGTSAWEERVRFTLDGAAHYIVSAMGKGGPEFDRHGWPVNATALIVKTGGRFQQYNCAPSDEGSISRPNLDLFPREAFDDDLRPFP